MPRRPAGCAARTPRRRRGTGGRCGSPRVRPGSDPRDLLLSLPARLRRHQRLFDSTGGVHAAGIFDTEGAAVVVREDVGRHNAVDKAVGHCLLQRIDPAAAVLCTSGRLGFEIVQKAAVAGIGTVVAVGAPTSLAVDLAARTAMTVVGFVRGDRMVVYSGGVKVNTSP
ncbi:MAG: formate dehydrogenase accessory sulfurtransferase FdhD [Nocardioidaceae bacterium]